MPDRPPEQTFIAKINDFSRRLREVERLRPPTEGTDNPLQTFENGNPLGDTRFLDFGPNIHAELMGDGFVQVRADAKQGEFDAIVDSTLSVSDPVNRYFLGIGEALSYLNTVVGLTRALVLVRPGTYTETANWTNPATVYLFGVGVVDWPNDNPVVWNTGNFSGSVSTDWNLNYMSVSFGTTKTVALSASSSANSLVATGCRFALLNTNANFDLNSDGDAASYVNCGFDSMRNLGGRVVMSACDVLLRDADGANPQPIADTGFYAFGLTVVGSSGTSRSWSLPSRATVFLAEGVNRLVIASGCNLTLTSGAAEHLYINSAGKGNRINVTVTGASANNVTLEGAFGAITLPAPLGASGVPHQVRASVNASSDITGPANISLEVARGTAQLTLRGSITGQVISRFTTLASGAFINGVSMGASSLNVVAGGGLASGTAQPYILDAGSSHNFIMWPNLVSWANAGTDSGSNNRIETTPGGGPSGSAPANADFLVGTADASLTNEIVVGPTPGGELAGAGSTWAVPVITDVHTGSEHADFVPVAGYVAGHVIEDEGVPLTQRADLNFEGAGVTAADAGGKTVVTIPGGSGTPATTVEDETTFGITPAVGTGTDYARDDHTHGSPAAPTVPDPATTVTDETTFGITPAVGVATDFAREDHTHGSPTAPSVPTAGDTVVTETTYGQGAAGGVDPNFSREDHTHGTPAVPAHNDLSSVTADQHHAQSHAHNGGDSSGTVAHADTTGQTVDDHHDEDHAARHAENGADELDVAALGSGAAGSGEVATADGAGGVDWSAPAAPSLSTYLDRTFTDVTKANTSSEETLYSFSVPAADLGSKGLEFHAWGTYFNNSGAARTLRLSLDLGGFNFTATTEAIGVAGLINRRWFLHGLLWVPGSTSTETIKGYVYGVLTSVSSSPGTFFNPNSGGSPMLLTDTDSSVVDVTTAQTLSFTSLHSAANANLSITMEGAILKNA